MIITIQKGKIYCQNQNRRGYHKLLVETRPLEIDRCKSKNGTPVSEALALFNCSSGGLNLTGHTFEKGVVNSNRMSRYLEVELNASIISA